MLNPNFRVFGIHIWLQNHNKTTMRCIAPATPAPQQSTTVTYKEGHHNGRGSPDANNVDFSQNGGDKDLSNHRKSEIIQPPLSNKKSSGGNSTTQDTSSMCLFLFVCILRTVLSNFIVLIV